MNWIAADIVRIQNGILVEHWDVIQDEATKEQSRSKAPTFGAAFQRIDITRVDFDSTGLVSEKRACGE
jgi:hypothetical protein